MKFSRHARKYLVTAFICLVALAATVNGQAQTATPSTSQSPGTVALPVSSAPTPAPAAAQPMIPNPAVSTAASTTIAPSVATQIGPGDLLKVSVLGAPDFDQQLRVSDDGTLPLALTGPVHIAGLTSEQAAGVLRDKLMKGGFFADPQVSVFQMEYATQGVSVLGEVLKPGVYPLLGPHRLFDMLSQAGGTSPTAAPQVSITHRDQPHSPEIVTMSNDPVKNSQANVEIRPGDTVVVSRAGVVYVVGNVQKPTGVIMNTPNMTVMQAIAMAEGTAPNSNLNGAKIIRRTAEGPKEIPIELKKIMSAKAPDVKLQPEDIVFVPGSAAKSAGKRTLEAAIQAATGMAIWTVRP